MGQTLPERLARKMWDVPDAHNIYVSLGRVFEHLYRFLGRLAFGRDIEFRAIYDIAAFFGGRQFGCYLDFSHTQIISKPEACALYKSTPSDSAPPCHSGA